MCQDPRADRTSKVSWAKKLIKPTTDRPIRPNIFFCGGTYRVRFNRLRIVYSLLQLEMLNTVFFTHIYTG